jgi:hypothetical protein
MRNTETALSRSKLNAAAYAGARKLVPGKTVRIPGLPIALAAAIAGGGVLLALGGGAAHAVLQPRAEKELDGWLRRLTESRSRSAQVLDQATPTLEMLHALTAELAILADASSPA